MSFIYSQALVAEYSAANCSDINAFAQSNGSHTPNPSWWHDKTMATSRHSRFGMTFSPLTESLGAELLTWWLEGFPAKTSALLERAQVLTEPEAECGGTWLGWLAKFDLNSSSWKTAQLSLIGDLGESLATFPRSGMTRGGLLWELPMLERPTNETGCGSWPTPTASKARSEGSLLQYRRLVEQGVLNRQEAELMAQGSLTPPRMRAWPTPTASNGLDGGSHSRAACAKVGLEVPTAGALNPTWVEWLMGWPIGWTALKPSETAKFQFVPQPHGELLEGLEA